MLSYTCSKMMGMAAAWVQEMAATSPGAELFAQLEAVDPRRCTGAELVDLVHAQYRQVAYQQSRLLLAVRELAFATKTTAERSDTIDGYADAELAFALTITDYGAGVLLSAATAAVDKLPALHQALAAGRVDLATGQHADQRAVRG